MCQEGIDDCDEEYKLCAYNHIFESHGDLEVAIKMSKEFDFDACNCECEELEQKIKIRDLTVEMYLETLWLANKCSEVSYSDMCNIFEQLIRQLNSKILDNPFYDCTCNDAKLEYDGRSNDCGCN